MLEFLPVFPIVEEFLFVVRENMTKKGVGLGLRGAKGTLGGRGGHRGVVLLPGGKNILGVR